jgi:hypothetical protein
VSRDWGTTLLPRPERQGAILVRKIEAKASLCYATCPGIRGMCSLSDPLGFLLAGGASITLEAFARAPKNTCLCAFTCMRRLIGRSIPRRCASAPRNPAGVPSDRRSPQTAQGRQYFGQLQVWPSTQRSLLGGGCATQGSIGKHRNPSRTKMRLTSSAVVAAATSEGMFLRI